SPSPSSWSTTTAYGGGVHDTHSGCVHDGGAGRIGIAPGGVAQVEVASNAPFISAMRGSLRVGIWVGGAAGAQGRDALAPRSQPPAGGASPPSRTVPVTCIATAIAAS